MKRTADQNRDRIIPAMRRLCGDDLSGQNVLDLACGFGSLSFFLEKRHADVTGIDFSAVLIQEARQQAARRHSNVKFILADATALPFRDDAQFDLIVCNMALQDIEGIDRAFSETRRVGKPGARGLFSIRHPWTDGWREDYTETQELRLAIQEEWQDKTTSRTYPARYHRPLEYYINMLLANGFTIAGCEEITDREVPPNMPLALILATVLNK
jgi:ubiquinone/menaquinone biosynthesis C-methylase UbiE